MDLQGKKRDINAIIEQYQPGGAVDKFIGKHPAYTLEAWYQPSGANWAYNIGLFKVNGILYRGVFVFGELRAAVEVAVPEAEA